MWPGMYEEGSRTAIATLSEGGGPERILGAFDRTAENSYPACHAVLIFDSRNLEGEVALLSPLFSNELLD